MLLAKITHNCANHNKTPKSLTQVPKAFLDQRKINEYWKGYKLALYWILPKMPMFGILLSSRVDFFLIESQFYYPHLRHLQHQTSVWPFGQLGSTEIIFLLISR